MLVISRKTGESLVIADNIRITVVSAGGDKVALGIDAPREISVLRSELAETIESNKAGAEKPVGGAYADLASLLKKSEHLPGSKAE